MRVNKYKTFSVLIYSYMEVVVVDLFNLPVGLFRFKLQYYVLKFTI